MFIYLFKETAKEAMGHIYISPFCVCIDQTITSLSVAIKVNTDFSIGLTVCDMI